MVFIDASFVRGFRLATRAALHLAFHYGDSLVEFLAKFRRAPSFCDSKSAINSPVCGLIRLFSFIVFLVFRFFEDSFFGGFSRGVQQFVNAPPRVTLFAQRRRDCERVQNFGSARYFGANRLVNRRAFFCAR